MASFVQESMMGRTIWSTSSIDMSHSAAMFEIASSLAFKIASSISD